MQSNDNFSAPKTRVKTFEKISFQKRVALLHARKSATVPRNPDVVRPRRQLDTTILLETLDSKMSLAVSALIDSGCTISCIDQDVVHAYGFKTVSLNQPIRVLLADGSPSGNIDSFVKLRMTIQGHTEEIPLCVAKLGTAAVFLGYDWLEFHNPILDWTRGLIEFARCPDACKLTSKDDVHEAIGLKPGEQFYALDWETYIDSKVEDLCYELFVVL